MYSAYGIVKRFARVSLRMSRLGTCLGFESSTVAGS